MTRRETLRLGATMFAGALLGACATGDGYHARVEPAGAGYAEERLDETRWRVEFTGREGDTREIVETNLLRRAAELTFSSGYDWFVASHSELDAQEEVIVEARPARQSPVWRPQWRRRRLGRWTDWMPMGGAPTQPAASPPRVQAAERFAAREQISMGRGSAPNGAFEARRVLSDLTPAISGS